MTARRLTVAALVAGAAFALLPGTASASRYCDLTFYALTGHCSVCEVVRPDGPCPR